MDRFTAEGRYPPCINVDESGIKKVFLDLRLVTDSKRRYHDWCVELHRLHPTVHALILLATDPNMEMVTIRDTGQRFGQGLRRLCLQDGA